jgi:hypothetical protein
VLVEQTLSPVEMAIYVGGFVAGLAAGWAVDRYTFVLQRRMVLGWAEHWVQGGRE